MGDLASVLLSASILAPFGIGLVRLRHLADRYLPLLLLLGIGIVAEAASFLFYRAGNEACENIYFLLEAILYCWLFRGWGHVLRSKLAFYTVTGALLLLWITDNLVLHRIAAFNPLFQVVYSLCLVFFAVDEMNWLIVNEHGQIITNARFIICISVVLFFAYKASAEVFYHYADDYDIKEHIFALEAVLNVAFNALLALAFLCVPRKIDFTSRY